jgi:ADP-ribose pyrophosphatase YjhB (NUDIX family)
VHKLVADVCVLADGGVLLVRYRDTTKYDGEGGWFLPDDFLMHEEHPQRAARRILGDQVGLEGARPVLAFVESFGMENGAWHLIFHHRLDLAVPPRLAPSPALADMRWFALDALPAPDDVAHHGWALELIERHRKGEVSDQP